MLKALKILTVFTAAPALLISLSAFRAPGTVTSAKVQTTRSSPVASTQYQKSSASSLLEPNELADTSAPSASGSQNAAELTKPAYETVARAAAKIKIDGVVDVDSAGNPTGEWAGAQALNIAGATDSAGGVHGANVFLTYDYDYLYVGAKIKDPTPMASLKTGSDIWGDDCLELFMGQEDLDCTGNPGMEYNMLPSDVQVVFGGGKQHGYQSYTNIAGVFSYPNIVMGETKDGDGKGYTIEAAVPLSSLGITAPWQGTEMILNANLCDGSTSGLGQWGWTTDSNANKKYRIQWGLATFALSSQPTQQVTVTTSVEGQTAAISGKCQSEGARDLVLIVRDQSNAIAYIDNTRSDAAGNYTFSVKLKSRGDYTVSVGGEGIEVPATASFTY